MKLCAAMLAISLCCSPAGRGQSGRPEPVTALVFSPDGTALCVNSHKSVVIRRMEDGRIRGRLECDFDRIEALAFHPSGQVLAAGGGTPGESGQVDLFDWNTGRRMGKVEDFDDLVTSIAFSSDGRQMGSVSADHSGEISHFNPNETKAALAFTLTDHAGPVLSTAFSPDGEILVTASADRSLKVWESGTGTLLRTFSNHTAPARCLAIRPRNGNGKTSPFFCASGSDDKTVRVWQPGIGRMVRIVRQHEGPILALAYSRDGQRLFSAGTEGVIRIIDADSDAILGKWKGHDDWIYALAVSPDGLALATGDWAGKVKVWNLREEMPRLISSFE